VHALHLGHGIRSLSNRATCRRNKKRERDQAHDAELAVSGTKHFHEMVVFTRQVLD
jgi:hypothetical protein